MDDEPRLVEHAIDAFVDRTPIEWAALRSRANTAPEYAVVESLYLLDGLRDTVAPPQRRRLTFSYAVVAPVVALAGIQTAASLVIVGLAYAHGETDSNRVPQVALAYGFSAASLVLGVGVTRDPRILHLLAWFALAASAFARHALTDVPAAFAVSIDPIVRGVAPEAFMPACLWQFASDFPRVTRFEAFDTVARRAAALAWLLGLVLFVGNFTAAYELINGATLGFALRSHPSLLYWHVISFATVPAVAAIFFRSRRAPVPERRRVARLASAIAVGTGPFLLLDTVLALSPQAYQWAVTAAPAERFWLDVVVLGGLVATPILATIAVVVDRPFELQALLRPRSVYAFWRVLLNASTIAPFIPFAVTLYQQRHGSLAQIFSGATGLLLFGYAAIGCTLLALRARLVGILDRRLSHRSVEHYQQLAQTLERIRLARGVREIAVVLARELRRGTGARTVTLLLPDRSGHFVDESDHIGLLPLDSGLVAMLREVVGPLDVSANGEVQRLLPRRDRDWTTTNDIAMLAPLKYRDEEIAGVLAVGPKRRGLPFDQRDRWLMATLATAAAATWSDADARDDSRVGRPSDESRDRQSREAAFECPRCGIVSSTPPLPCRCEATPVLAALPARLADKFVLERRLGAGGMGIVYLARDISLDRDVALKTLPHLAAGTVARLRDEARAMATLNHQSLAVIYGLEEWRRTPVLVVEYLPNGTLAQRLTRGPFTPAEMIPLGMALARALIYMHARGVLHRDLKPSNIGFTAAGTPKLLDFGLAVLTEPAFGEDTADTTLSHPVRAGTSAYLPPEAFAGAPASATFDLWALSLVLREAVTGVNPFAEAHGGSATHLVTPSPGLSRFFDRTLDPDPERRPRTAADLLAALDALRAATR